MSCNVFGRPDVLGKRRNLVEDSWETKLQIGNPQRTEPRTHPNTPKPATSMVPLQDLSSLIPEIGPKCAVVLFCIMGHLKAAMWNVEGMDKNTPLMDVVKTCENTVVAAMRSRKGYLQYIYTAWVTSHFTGRRGFHHWLDQEASHP